MANQDRVNFVWAETALTTIPPIPVSEVAYRDTTQTPEQMEVGQQYDTIYNSARYNQLLFLLTSVAKTLCENGIMPFLAGQEYSQYARCIFTDGKLYAASRAILANEQPYPTPGDDSGVWTAEGTNDNLVPDSRRVIAGTGLTGGGPLSADVTLAAKLTDSVNTTDSTTAASATAVKAAYDRGTKALTEARQKVSKTLDDATGTLPLTNGGTGRTDGQCPGAQALLLNGTFGGAQAKLLWAAQDAVTYLLGANPEGTGLYPILPNKVVVGEAITSSICKGVFTFTGNHPKYLPSSGTWKGFTCPAQSGDLFFCGVKSGGAVVTNPTGALQYGLYVRTA